MWHARFPSCGQTIQNLHRGDLVNVDRHDPPAEAECRRARVSWKAKAHAPADGSGRRTSCRCSRSCSASGSRAAGRPRCGRRSAWSCSTWGSRSTALHTGPPAPRRTPRGTRRTRGSEGPERLLSAPSALGGRGEQGTGEDRLPWWDHVPYRSVTLRRWRRVLKRFQTDVFEENTGRHQKLSSWGDYGHGQPGAGS